MGATSASFRQAAAESGGLVTGIPCGMLYMRGEAAEACMECAYNCSTRIRADATTYGKTRIRHVKHNSKEPAKMQVDVMKDAFCYLHSHGHLQTYRVILVQINPPTPSFLQVPVLTLSLASTDLDAGALLVPVGILVIRRLPQPAPSSIPADKHEETHPRPRVGLESKTPDPCPGAQGRANGLTPDHAGRHSVTTVFLVPEPILLCSLSPQIQNCSFQKSVERGVVP